MHQYGITITTTPYLVITPDQQHFFVILSEALNI